MKQLFTLLCFAITAYGLQAQQLVSVFRENMQDGYMEHYATELYAYTPDGHVESITTLMGLSEFARKTYTHDNSGNVLTEIHEDMDDLTQTWQNRVQYTSTYAADGKLLTQQSLLWIGGNWTNTSQTVYLYDGNGFMYRVEFNNWQAGAWTPSAKYELTTNAQGNVTESMYYQYQNGSWSESTRDIHIYSTTGLLEALVMEIKVGNAWVNQSKNSFVYDQNDLTTSNIVQSWVQNAWKNDYRFLHTYNADETIDVFTMQYWHETQQVWKDTSRAIYNYGFLQTTENSLASSKVYPNPAQETVYLEFGKNTDASITLLDLSGKIVKTVASSGLQHSVSLAGIPTGTYLLSTVADGKREITRIVKQ